MSLEDPPILLLASRSAARRRMLEAAGIGFAVVDAPLDEGVEKARLREKGLSAPELAGALAAAKARSADAPGAMVLGADQTLELDDGQTLDKPVSRDDLAAQLKRMSGRSHKLHSAAAVVLNGALLWHEVESVTLTMRTLSAGFVAAYLDVEYDAVRWNVGGYRIEGPGVQLFSAIEGSHFAILGLPLLPLLAWLRKSGCIAR